MDKIQAIRTEIERLIKMNKTKHGFPAGAVCAMRIEAYGHLLSFLDTLSEEPELVRHPPIAYTYPSDASRDEQLKMALLALLNSDLIKVAGNKFTKQDLIDWVEKQKEQKPVYNLEIPAGDVAPAEEDRPSDEEEEPVTICCRLEDAVGGTVHHAINCHYIMTDQEALNARLRGIPEGTAVNIFICEAKEE